MLRGRIARLLEAILKFLRLHNSPQIRIIPILGPLTNSVGVIAKTPCHKRFPLSGCNIIVATTMNTVQQQKFSVQFVDAKGHPAKVDGIPEWKTDNTDLVALTPDADGMGCLVTPVGMPGTCNIQVSADADLGEGVTLVVGTAVVEITQAPATSVVITPGPVEEQP